MGRSPSERHGSPGAQTIDRACVLIKEIARCGTTGVRLVELTASTGLSRPTVHRILQSLAAADFIRQDPATKRYKFGVGIHGLALAAPSPLESLTELRPLLDDLAARTGDVAYFMLRRGDEVLCLARAEGAAPIRTFLIDVGAVRPIGTTIAGVVMMSALPDEEIDEILRRTGAAMRRYRNATPDYVRRQITNVRRNGYCISESMLIKGATGISAAVPQPNGPPFLAVSLSAITSRVPKTRVKPLVDDLLRTCTKMAQVLARAPHLRAPSTPDARTIASRSEYAGAR